MGLLQRQLAERAGALTVYNGEEVVARFTERVKNWWTQEA